MTTARLPLPNPDAIPPGFLPLDPAGLPDDPVMAKPRFVCFKLQPKANKPGKWDKIPITPSTGDNAKTDDPATWDTPDRAIAAYPGHGCHGISIVVTKEEGVAGIDLDNCRDPDTGAIAPWARAIIERFSPCYWGPSVSGTGIRILVRASLPAGGKNGAGIEVYDNGRHLTLTGHLGDTAIRTLEPRQAALDAVLAEYWPPQVRDAGRPRPTPRPRDLDAEALLARALDARDGGKFRRLWDGDDRDYDGDTSDGDFAFCAKAAFWTGGDPTLIDAWYRQSRRARAKWDERHYADGRTYGEATIANVLDRVRDFYDPTRAAAPSGANFAPEPEPEPDDDDDDLDTLDAEALRALARAERRRRREVEARATRAEAESRELRQHISLVFQAQRNPAIKAERGPIMATMFELHALQNDPEAYFRGDVRAGGWVRIPNQRIAEKAGLKSAKSAGRAIEQGAKWDFFEKRVEMNYVTKDGRGEPRRETWLRPKVAIADGLQRLATFTPPPEPEKTTWGGRADRGRCKDHPHAAIRRAFVDSCSVCGKEVGRGEHTYHPDAPMGQDDPASAAAPTAADEYPTPPPPKDQDGPTVVDHAATVGAAPPSPPARGRGTPEGSRWPFGGADTRTGAHRDGALYGPGRDVSRAGAARHEVLPLLRAGRLAQPAPAPGAGGDGGRLR